MNELYFDYYMQIDYEKEVSRCNFTIKCIPMDNARQQIRNVNIELFPATGYNKGVDGLGNQQIYGTNEIAHKTFYFHITGEALVGLADYEEMENDDLSMIFRHPYGLNKAGDGIRAYYQKLNIPDGNILEKAEAIMHQLYRDFVYEPFLTNVKTTAEEAFLLGRGVCQDYAHIFIALLHLTGITARYTTGLIVGEGASHAWVEVLLDGKWYGYDPTNDKKVGDEYIKIGVGRDAHDCMINRGIMHGGGFHHQIIRVSVQPKGKEIKQ